MKKDGFNPRMNSEINKNIFKLSTEELDEQNKLMENELKKKKLINNFEKNKIKAIKNPSNNYANKIKIISNQNMNRSNTDLEEEQNRKINNKIKNTNLNNISHAPLIDQSFLSYNRDQNQYHTCLTERSESANANSKINKNQRNDGKNNIARSNSNMSSFKNKLNSTIFISSNVEIKTTKTPKNLIPLKNKHDEDAEIKKIVGKLKICQKVHLPHEKNYFVSEKNLKLIEEALSDKDSDIDNLKMLLSFTKNDIDNFQLKYNEQYKIMEELMEEKNKILFDYESLVNENKSLKENYDDYAFQYNKILIYLKKVENLSAIAFKISDGFKDVLHVDENRKNDYVQITKKSKLYNLLLQLQELLGEGEIRAFASLFLSKKENIDEKMKNSIFLLTPINKDYLKLEKMNKHLKNKLYDYENLMKKVSHMYESNNKGIGLTEIAKDMIEMKNRITEIYNLNDNLEKENEYLRISYHNIYNELFNNEDKRKSENELQNNKIIENNLGQLNKELIENNRSLEKINFENSDKIKTLSNELDKLNEQFRNSKFESDKYINDFISKEKKNFDLKIEDLKVTISNLNEDLDNKQKIINELKLQVSDLIKEKSLYKSSQVSTQNKDFSGAQFIKKDDEEDSKLKDYLNKSDDNININKPYNSMNDDKILHKKILKYELELKYLKDKLKDKENDELFLEIDKKKNKTNSCNNYPNYNDLIYHLYNQSKIIEKLN